MVAFENTQTGQGFNQLQVCVLHMTLCAIELTYSCAQISYFFLVLNSHPNPKSDLNPNPSPGALLVFFLFLNGNRSLT